MNNIIEFDKLIYAGAKQISDKLGIPLKNTTLGWEMRLEGQIKKLRQQAKLQKKVKYWRRQWNKKTKKKKKKKKKEKEKRQQNWKR